MKKLFSILFAIGLVVTLAACTQNEEVMLKVGRTLSNPHGDKAFADVVVVLSGDKIIAASINEYQFGSKETFKGVPNNVAANEINVVYSKLENDTPYSNNMKKAGSTQSFMTSIHAIQNFAVGKTINELEEFLNDNEATNGPDAITGSTLSDTKGYLKSIVDTAKVAKEIGELEASKLDIKVGRILDDPHGDQAFADVVVILNGNQILTASLNEYQFGSSETFKGVPNNIAANDINVLYSKLENDTPYSNNMKKAGSTQSFMTSIEAIQKFATGKTTSELAEFLNDNEATTGPDVITGSTLTDTKGYLASIIKAANIAK